MGATGTHFIDSDLELAADQRLEPEPSPPCTNFMPQPFGGGDQQRSVWASASSKPPQQTSATPLWGSTISSDSSMLSPRSLDSSFSRRKSLPRPVRPLTPPRQSLPVNVQQQGLGAVNKVAPNSNSPTLGRGRAGSVERKGFFQKWFKADGDGARRSSSSPVHSRKSSPAADSQRKSLSAAFNKDIPPELQGVSVKELVKVIGASRANGNGVTPPGTPGNISFHSMV